MNVLTYRIRLIEPLLATRLLGDPNSSVSFAYAPGSLIRGAVIRMARQANGGLLDAGDEHSRRLFFSGATRFLHAYPVASRRRMLPIPLTWHRNKNDALLEHNISLYDFALDACDAEGEYAPTPAANPRQFVRVAGDDNHFCWISGANVEIVEPSFQVNVHTARDRMAGRALGRRGDGGDQAAGAVFQYVALAAGAELGGAILCQTPEDADTLRQLLAGVNLLGGSANGGYGQVAIEIDAGDGARQTWREVPTLPAAIPAGEPFTVTLTSEALVRDEVTGQPGVDIMPALARLLGADLKPVVVEDGDVEMRSVQQVRLTGGFNRQWGLPLPQMQALAAGSVFVYTANRPLAVPALQAAEHQGIGERRAEGFGCFLLNWNHEPELTLRRTRSAAAEASLPVLTGAAQHTAKLILDRLLRRDLDAALIQRVNRTELKNMPSKHQLARFRTIIRNELPAQNLERLKILLAEIETRRTTREQFERARVDGQRLNQWLHAYLDSEKSQGVWEALGAANYRRQLGSNVVSSAENDLGLAREYTMRLIDAVMAKAARARKEEN